MMERMEYKENFDLLRCWKQLNTWKQQASPVPNGIPVNLLKCSKTLTTSAADMLNLGLVTKCYLDTERLLGDSQREGHPWKAAWRVTGTQNDMLNAAVAYTLDTAIIQYGKRDFCLFRLYWKFENKGCYYGIHFEYQSMFIHNNNFSFFPIFYVICQSCLGEHRCATKRMTCETEMENFKTA